MSATIELDEARRRALAKLARRRKLPLRRVLERAVDEFINRSEEEDLLSTSAQIARRTGLREANAVELIRSWRQKDRSKNGADAKAPATDQRSSRRQCPCWQLLGTPPTEPKSYRDSVVADRTQIQANNIVDSSILIYHDPLA